MFLAFFVQLLAHPLAWLEQLYLRWTQLPQSSVALGCTLDLPRLKSELLLENALLRQQLVTLRVQRHVKNPDQLAGTVSRSCFSPAGFPLGSKRS